MEDLRKQIFRIVDPTVYADGSEMGNKVDQILALIDREVAEARIEELKKCLDWEGHEPFIKDRLQELSKDRSEDA